MQKWNGSLLRKFDDTIDGNVSVGTTVVVRNTVGNTIAVVYDVDDTNSVQKNNPFVTDDFGRYSFFAPNGKYTIEFGDGSDSIEIVLVDNLELQGLLGLTEPSDLAQRHRIKTTVTEIATDAFKDGDRLEVTDRANAKFNVVVGGAADGASILNAGGGNTAILDEAVKSPQMFGCVADGVVDDTTPWNAWLTATGSKVIPAASYLVSGVVKVYPVASFANTLTNNHSAGLEALESCVNGLNNTGFGRKALQKTNGVLPLGSNNSAFGFETLGKNTEGYRSSAFGYQALHEQQGNLVMGNSNCAFGYQTLYNNTTGKDNQAFGYLSMFFNVAGGGNTASGYRALYSNVGTDTGAPAYAAISGSFNASFGYESMLQNTFGNSNSAFGWRSLQNNTTGNRNTVNGQEVMRDNITGGNNTASGYQALSACVNGSENSVFGYQALLVSTATARNSSFGYMSMAASTSAVDCSAFGHESLVANTGGINNTAVGRRALSRNTTGNGSTAIGFQALEFTTTGGSNLAFDNCSGLGNGARISASNQVQLGNSATTTYAFGAVQDRSDARDKIDISEITDEHIAFFMDIEWKQYRLNYRDSYIEIDENDAVNHIDNDGSRAGTRYHMGAIAQQVEMAMKKHGVDFAGLQHHIHAGGEDIYTIGYQEFIALQGFIIQKQQLRMGAIESRLDAAGL